MQEALLALTRYWTERGCALAQPMNTEVGAGTMNPATFLRVLGPEPWRVAYVEPSVRPDDARYGENPNRIQTHTQFQVILKPEPGNAQELYLGSLAVLGIDVDAHDVRFVEDNWASPALGAWGLGWEVWLDGLEITQFTYFQQAGGISLTPVSVEITYGMERILMALQRVSHFKDIRFTPGGISYGEIFGQAEYEMSRYYLDEADVLANRSLLDLYENEASRMLAARLPIPAYSYVLKCSHTFNVLDARGAVSPTDRARVFARIRRLAGGVARLWMERREELGYPVGVSPEPPVPVTAALRAARGEPATLVFEIGVEELPAAEVTAGVAALQNLLGERLAASRLGHGPVIAFGTPRRLVAVVPDVAPRQDDRDVQVRGPRVQAAYAPDGTPTRAATGFARAQNVPVTELSRVEAGGAEYVTVSRRESGRPAAEILAELLPGVVSALPADSNMRWDAPGLAYVRPVRWLLALLGGTVLPFTVSSLASGPVTRIRNGARDTELDVPGADGYLEFLRDHGVIGQPSDRRQMVVDQAAELAAAAGGEIPFAAEASLLDEITNLVEQPNAILGGYEERYLELPHEVLATVMRKHQRYLPVRRPDGSLSPHFVAVADGPCSADLVRSGNEAVLRARFEDASFFWRADLATTPAEFHAALSQLTFEERLGTMLDRARRIAALAADLADVVGLSAPDRDVVRRSAALVKFDLASKLVTELPSLAGLMARTYARHAGEPEPVAEALYEAELPRHADDALPVTLPGALLSIADRLDLLAGLFAVGAEPTGSSDPFGLRRTALGLVNVLRGHPALTAITISRGLGLAARHQPVPTPDAVPAAAAAFVIRRHERQLLDAGYRHAFVQAVLPLADAPAVAEETLAELAKRAEEKDFADLVQAIGRVCRIVPAGTPAGYDVSPLREPAEVTLHEAVTRIRAELGAAPYSLASFVAAATPAVEPVNTFFDQVLVMAEDPGVRAARLGLLASIAGLASEVLDWSRL
ncbi:MAG: glycine--tRNA ligase [Streptosporangiaceae bacterium]